MIFLFLFSYHMWWQKDCCPSATYLLLSGPSRHFCKSEVLKTDVEQRLPRRYLVDMAVLTHLDPGVLSCSYSKSEIHFYHCEVGSNIKPNLLASWLATFFHWVNVKLLLVHAEFSPFFHNSGPGKPPSYIHLHLGLSRIEVLEPLLINHRFFENASRTSLVMLVKTLHSRPDCW